MRRKTIKQRLKLSNLNEAGYNFIYSLMYGIPDETTVHGGENNERWASVVKQAFDYPEYQKLEIEPIE